MLIDLAPVRKGRDKSRTSFSGLMDIYEQNYIRLRKLAPDLDGADKQISLVPDHQNLFLSITERCKYTTMLRLTYQFGSESNPIFEPDLSLIIYHDAKVVEVQQYYSRRFGRFEFSDLLEQKMAYE